MSGELIELLEKATGPDRELDCLIWCATAESHFEYHGGECVLAVQGGFAARLDWNDMPHPTASIDAALKLVPEGWNRRLSESDKHWWWAELRQGHETSYDKVAIGQSPTAAIALCIAALEARATIAAAKAQP